MQTTEELKRAMYGAMENLRLCVITDRVPYVSFPSFEGRLEQYLEALRVDQAQAAARIETLELAAASAARLAQEGTNTNRLAGEELRRRGEVIRQQQEKIEHLRKRVRMFEEQNSASMQAWAQREMEKARNVPSDAILDGVAMVHQEKRENAQEVPSAKPRRHSSWIDRLRFDYWRQK